MVQSQLFQHNKITNAARGEANGATRALKPLAKGPQKPQLNRRQTFVVVKSRDCEEVLPFGTTIRGSYCLDRRTVTNTTFRLTVGDRRSPSLHAGPILMRDQSSATVLTRGRNTHDRETTSGQTSVPRGNRHDMRGFVRASELMSIDENRAGVESPAAHTPGLHRERLATTFSSLEESLMECSIEDVQRRFFCGSHQEGSVSRGERLLRRLGISDVDSERFVAAMGQNCDALDNLLDSLDLNSNETPWKNYYGVPADPVDREEARIILGSLGILWNDIEALENRRV